MTDTKKCQRCGIQNSISVNITATCAKCGKSVLLCGNCKHTWKIQNCPSCGAGPANAKWNFLEQSGSGTVTDDMMSYLSSYDSTAYIKAWNASKEKLASERAADGDAAHRGVALAAEEVSFLRKLEDNTFRPIFTVADDRASYVVIEDGHITRLRMFNSDLRNGFGNEIKVLQKMREFRVERSDKRGASIVPLPDALGDCASIESVVLRSCPEDLNIDVLGKLPNLKKLSVMNTYNDLSGKAFAQVFAFTGLEELHIGGCRVRVPEINEIGKLVNLKKLNLAWLNLQNGPFREIPATMANLQDLEELDLTGTEVGYQYGGAWPEFLASLPKLKLIFFKPNQLAKGVVPFLAAMRLKAPGIYPPEDLSPAEERKMSISEVNNWWQKQFSETLRAGWTGIE